MRRRLAAILLLASAPAAAGGAALPEPLAPFTAEYRVTNGSMRLGTTTISLQPHAAGWRYRSVTEADGVVSLFVSGKAIESTLLEPYDGRLRPTVYDHAEPDDDDNIRVEFDWDNGTAAARDGDGDGDGGGARTLELGADTVDGFSATLALIQALARGEERIRIATIDDEGKPETLEFRQTGRESIRVPFGTFDTVRVDRIRRGKDRETITWLAPELDWVAVRIDQRRDGELTGRLELTGLQGEAARGD